MSTPVAYVKRWVEAFLLTFSAASGVGHGFDQSSQVTLPPWALFGAAAATAALKATIQVGLMWSSSSPRSSRQQQPATRR